jgi:hypothetical protein
MLELLVGAVVNVAILVAAWKLWRWSRKQAAAGRMAWRRRVGLTFLLAPMLLALLTWVGLPEALLLPLKAIALMNQGIDFALSFLITAAREHLPGPLAVAIKPLCYAIVYGGLGVLIGWPLDRWKAKKDAEQAAQGTDGGGGPPSDGSSPA